ncbi:MAG: methionine--tRNA ligase subunit beta, partial [Terracidiphilus sp.]
SWGIPVPGDEKHVIYVWLDALANYITALGYESDDAADRARFEKFWPADMHLIGKEISRFHCVYWPAFLMAAGIALPRSVKANGWLLFDQGKMSKSRGRIVRAETVQDVLGADALRYFLLREIPFGQDGGFSFDALVQRYNGDLANGYGNLVSRVVNMVHKYFDGVVPEADAYANVQMREASALLVKTFGDYFDALDFSRALESVWGFIAIVDFFLTSTAPWKKPADIPEEAQQHFRAAVLYAAAEAIRIITALVYPIMPESAAKVWRQLGQGEIQDAARQGFLTELKWGGLKAGTRFGEPAPLFPRAEKDAIDRMQALEDENNRSAVEAASRGGADSEPSAPSQVAAAQKAPAKQQPVSPHAPAPSKVAATHQGTISKPALSVAERAPQTRQNERGALAPEVRSSEKPLAVPQPSAVAPAASAPAATVSDAATAPQVITIDDFAKIDLQVAQILVAERVPKADKLLRLEVDLGYEKRQILAGIAQCYEPEKLIGRKIVIVANLAPRKMRGLESNGMLLAASLPDGAPVLAGFLEDVPLGARLK